MKKLSVELLDTVKSRIKELHNWREKPDTQAMVSKLIHDTLYEQLPDPSYTLEEVETFSEKLYRYIYDRYPQVAV